MVVLSFAGQPVAKVAILGGVFLLFSRQIKAHKVSEEIDRPLPVMFAGLVVAGFERVALTPGVIAAVARQHLDNTACIRCSRRPCPICSAIFLPCSCSSPSWPIWLIHSAPGWSSRWRRLWLTASRGSDVANLIVAQRTQGAGIKMGF